MNISLNLVALSTIVRKEMVRVLRIWIQTVVPPAITMTLYFIIFGNLIGRRIGTMEGFDYMQYIAPGLIMMSVITNSYGNVVSSFFGAKFGKHVEEMLVAPMSYATIIIGHVAGGVLRGLLVIAAWFGLHFVVRKLRAARQKLSFHQGHAELRRGVLILIALSQLKQEKYGYALMSELGEKGLDIDLATVYNKAQERDHNEKFVMEIRLPRQHSF